jgi:hypothetical protein
MMPIEQLKLEIEMLSDKDFVRLRQWFAEKDWERWDQQLETDIASGKLDFLVDEAMRAKQQESLQEL